MMQDTEKATPMVAANILLKADLCLPLLSVFCLAGKPTLGSK